MSENGRRSLPRPRGSPRPLSIWTLLKDLIGISDLQSLPFPVDMIGPYTDGMIGAEHVMYTDLLDKAATEPKGSLERLSFVAAYTVAAYSLYPLKRTDKALDPLLNETFECIDEERAVRYISESVHARPRIQAECMEGQKWVLEGESEPRVVVWAHCLEFRVNWYQQVTFHDGEVYSWRKIIDTEPEWVLQQIPTFVYGGLKGVDHLYLRHKGTLCIRNHSTGFEVEGIVLDNGLPVQGISIQGQWNDKLYLMRSGHAPQLLWQAVPYPPLPSRYNWTYWSIMLGEIKPGMEQTLPCTDSRFRPDRILIEYGLYEDADAEHRRLLCSNEARTSTSTKSKKPLCEAHPALWFDFYDTGLKPGEGLRYRSNSKYWEARERGNFNSPDIFGLEGKGVRRYIPEE